MTNGTAGDGEKGLMGGRVLFCVVLVIVAAGLVSIPFVYPSMTLWYKFGLDRVLLLAGKVMGLLALLLVMLQIMAASRPALLVKLFGLGRIMRFHRVNGAAILGMVSGHVLLILGPEGFANLPVGYKHWPELVGAVLFCLFALLVVTSHFREHIRLSYPHWRRFHRPLGYLTIILLVIHVRWVSDSFTALVPQLYIGALLVLLALAAGWAKLRR